MKKPSKPTLADRISEIEKEVSAELDRLSEQLRPPGVPGPSLRQMWLAKAGGNELKAYLALTNKERTVKL